MKCKPKHKMAVVLITVAAVAAIFAAQYFGLATARSALRVGYIGSGGRSSWSASYVLLNGVMRRSVHPDGGSLHIETRTDGGALSIQVEDQDGGIVFEQSDVGTASYDIPVPGAVTVQVEGDWHRGSFRIGAP
ncbi:MAG: hypothetical protein HFF26_08755 [Oscillospiraceae bacterium]|nr:hypothetical protein [Oscillospiraceae bacterium]